ncbi:MAG: DUF6088 family protein [Vulcanimicrobiota bacterium]
MKIMDRIRRSVFERRPGEFFTAKEFLQLGSRAAVDQTLARLARGGLIKRVARGVYMRPRVHPALDPEVVSPNDVLRALAQTKGARIQLGGGAAAHLLGLTETIPEKVVYLTDAPSRTLQVGTETIELRHVSASTLVGCGTLAGDVVQAMRHVGKEGCTRERLDQLKDRLPPDTIKDLVGLIPRIASWMSVPISYLAGEDRLDPKPRGRAKAQAE